jgi:hypothetical protein
MKASTDFCRRPLFYVISTGGDSRAFRGGVKAWYGGDARI